MNAANGPYGTQGATPAGSTPPGGQPPSVPPQGVHYVSEPGDPATPRYGEPADPRYGTEDAGPTLNVGRYWAGAIATVAVAALIGWVAVFVLENVFNLTVDSPPLTGAPADAAAWAVAGALFALAAAVVLQLLVVSAPRPQTFFGWVISLVTIVLAALPFAGPIDLLPDLLTAIIWIVMGAAVWSLLTATLGRTYLVREPPVTGSGTYLPREP